MIIEINGNSYDVYADVVTADEYLAASTRFSEWDALTEGDKKRSLVSSTRLLDRQMWRGTITDPAQPLAFPRAGLQCNGQVIPSDVIPQQVIQSSIWLALDLATGSNVESQTASQQSVKRLKAGSVEIENFRLSASEIIAGRFPAYVMELLRCFLVSGNSLGGGFASGTQKKAKKNDYGFTEGI